MTRNKRPKPSPRPGPSAVNDSDGFLARQAHRWQDRRRAKKARIAAMSRGRRWGRRGLITGTWFLGLVAALMVGVIVAYYTLANVPRPEDLPLAQKATIEYSDGSTLATIGPVDRTIVHLSQVPKQVRWAVLAAEDRGFYSENAVSIRGTVRAALSDISGGNTQGGSGITQQYVKNAYLSNSQTLSRKIRELMIAVKLTREYSKDQILEFYLNTVYFGRGTYGIQAAAQSFFGENVEQLTTAQGALLAGLLRAPSYYDPAVSPKASHERWRYVLDGMVSTGHLTQAQENALRFPKTEPVRGNGLGTTGWKSLLTTAVLADLQAHGISEGEISARGLTIRTTINKKAQAAALSAIHETFDNLTKKQRNLKDALVAIDPSTGGVLAYYGGSGPGVKGYNGRVDDYDYASVGSRPPGSSFKPYTLATVLNQTLKQKPGKAHYAIDSEVNGSYCTKVEGTQICNDPKDKGVSSSQVTIAHAMKYSLNTTFDLLASQAGPSDVANVAHALGVSATDSSGAKTLQNSDGSTSFGIGIGDYPVTVLDQASGYATLADDGIRNDAFLVQSATASNGQVVYRHRSHPTQAINKRVANDVTLTMEPIAEYSGDSLSGGRDSAAKTGTEGIDSTKATTNNSDAWMVGFTPQVSAAVWVGSGTSQPIYNHAGTPLYGSQLPGKTWMRFMNTYLHGTKNVSLPDQQQIDTDGTTPSPTPTYTPSSYSPPPASDTATAPLTPANTPSSPTPTPAPTSSTPSSTPTTTKPTSSRSPNCGLLGCVSP